MKQSDRIAMVMNTRIVPTNRFSSKLIVLHFTLLYRPPRVNPTPETVTRCANLITRNI